MGKIVDIDEAIQKANKLNKEGKRIVLAGGCFDIIHIGHLTFLEQAKKQADTLFIFLEHDETIKKTKGSTRPINTQKDRAHILSHIDVVDYVIPLPDNPDYERLVIHIKPAIIATTKGDLNRSFKENQAKQINARVIDVTDEISNRSTTKLVKLLDEI